MNLPPKLKEEGALDRLGNELCMEIDLSESGKGSLPERWDRNEALYNLDPKATNLEIVPGMASYPIPLWAPKADRITHTVFKSFTGMDPYVQCIPIDSAPEAKKAAQRLERGLMSVITYETGKLAFDRAFRQCLKIAVNTGVAVLYMHLVDGCVQSEPIHPKDFCMYPHELGSIARAKTTGHRFWKTLEEIEEAKAAGEYLNVDVAGGDEVGERGGKASDFARTVDTPERTPEDGKVECWQLVTRRDLGEGFKNYLVCVAKTSQKVLKIDVLPYKHKLYFDIRFDDEYGSFWPARSIGQTVQGLQVCYTDLFNVSLHGSYSAAFPGVAIIGATLNTKTNRWGPGTVWELPSGASVQTVGVQFNGNNLVGLMPIVEKATDGVTGISQLGTSQNLPSGTTATAAQGFLQAQDEAKDAYSSFIAPTMAEVFDHGRDLLRVHYPSISKKMGSALEMEYSDIETPVRFEVTGKSTSSSPSALLQKLHMVRDMAANPNSKLDYQAVEAQIMEALDLPFDTQSLEKRGPSAEELTAVLTGLLSGQVTPEEAAMILQEAKLANQPTGTGGLSPQPGLQVPGEVPGGPTAEPAPEVPSAGY